MLKLVGLGLDDGEITRKGLEALKEADKAFAEFYTNTENIDLGRLEEEAGTQIEKLGRDEVEKQDRILEEAQDSEVAFLVSGDPLTATTHYDIKHRAEDAGVDTEVIHAPSIMTSVAETGLNVYKFGRVVTLPEDSSPESVIEHVESNDSIGLHTLMLLDIDYSASEAADKLVEMGVKPNREAVVLERANSEDQDISVMSLEQAAGAVFGAPPHSIILTGDKSHKEEEFLDSVL